MVVAALVTATVAQPQDGGRHSLFTEVLRAHVSNGLVDYNGVAGDPKFGRYLAQLARTNPDSIAGRNERLALWINAYNAYTIKLIIDEQPETSIRDISLGLPVLFGPWSVSFANVGGTEYTLNEIEHDIIREQFRDARIHSALVCASMSCPKLREGAYEGAVLDCQLDEEAERFINDPVLNRFDTADGTVTISRIFDWYESDFEEDAGSVRLFLARYVTDPEAKKLLWSEDLEFDYFPYDWSLNARPGNMQK